MDLYLQFCSACGTQFRILWLPALGLYGRNRRHPGRPQPGWSLSFSAGALHGNPAWYHLCGACQSLDPAARTAKAHRTCAYSGSPRRSLVTSLLSTDADRAGVSAERIKLTKAYLEIQAMQDSTYFESAEARVLDQPLRRLTQAAVELCAAAEAAASHRSGLLLRPKEITSRDIGVCHANEVAIGNGPTVSAWYALPMTEIWRLRVPGFERAWTPSIEVRNCLSRTSPIGLGWTLWPQL